VGLVPDRGSDRLVVDADCRTGRQSAGLDDCGGHDQLANAAFGGHEDETLSSRAGKAAREGKRWACVFCRLLDRLDPNHCEKAIEPDEGKPMT